MIKKENQIIRYSEFHVNVCYNLQPLQHNELTQCVQYNGIVYFSDRQCKVFWSHTSIKISPKTLLRVSEWSHRKVKTITPVNSNLL